MSPRVECSLVDHAWRAARHAWYWNKPKSWTEHIARLERELHFSGIREEEAAQ